MSTRSVVAVVAFVALLPGCTAGGGDRPALDAREVATAPTVDGRDDDAAWHAAPELIVMLEGEGAGPAAVHLRAVVHAGVLHVLARWPDATEDREHKVWTPKQGGGFEGGPEREDVLALAFPISGEFTADMLSPVECVWDVWQWKSARTDPAGFGMDKSHRNTFTDPGGKRHEHAFKDGRKLYVTRPEDAGTSATKSLKAPESGAGRAPQYAAQTPSGSAGDVRAKGAWREGWWTVELARPLTTGNADDAVLGAGPEGTKFAVAILDRGEDEDHSTSGILLLRIAR